MRINAVGRQRGLIMVPHWSDLFIVAFVWIAWSWSLPEDAPAKWLVNQVAKFVSWIGLWHSWRMFAPNPTRSTRRLVVLVEYADGSKYEWRPPGTLPEGPWPAFLHSRFRKFTDNVSAGKVKGLQWSTADYAVRRFARLLGAERVLVHVAVLEESWDVRLDQQPATGAAEQKRKVLFEQHTADGVLK
jgi:hypothetical protein